MKIRVNTQSLDGTAAFGLEAEREPGVHQTFFTAQMSPFGGEVVLFLRPADQRALFEALGAHLFNEEREMQE